MRPLHRLPLCSHSFNAGRAGNTVDKGLLKLIEIKETCANMAQCLDESQVFKTNNLMHMYVKRGNMVDARHVFDNMPNRDVVSWNIMILAYARQKDSAEALELYARMSWESVEPSDRTFVGILKACCSLEDVEERRQVGKKSATAECLEKGRIIHSEAVQRGCESDVFVGNALVDMYSKCDSMDDASRVFDELPHRDVVSWNAMILGYSKQEQGVLALDLYAQMQQDVINPDNRTFVGTLMACSSLAALDKGEQVGRKLGKTGGLVKGRVIHSQVVRSGFESDVFVGTALVSMYIKCGGMQDARHVFDNLHNRNVNTWTTMILGYSEQEDNSMALELYAQMHQEGVQPNVRTFVGALKACSSLAGVEEVYGTGAKTGWLVKGRAIHFQVVKTNFESDVVGNILVDMYVKCGNMEDAWSIFDKLPHREVNSWNAMIMGYSKHEECALALDLYAQMEHEHVELNARTFVAVLKACSSLATVEEGEQLGRNFAKVGCLEKSRAIHSLVIMKGFESDIFLGTTLVDTYVKYGSMEDAHRVFNELPHCDVVTWTSMILGYVKQGEGTLALDMYIWMQQEGVTPDHRTFVAAFMACSSLAGQQEGKQIDRKCGNAGSLEKGRAINSQVVENGFESDVFVGTALVDMYTKCGSIGDARYVFNELPHRNVVTWNSMILGYAEQDEHEEAFRLYARMQEQGLSPSCLTFVAILKACANMAGLQAGKELHTHIIRVGCETVTIVVNSLIDMYVKCGSMLNAQQLFEALDRKDVIPWSVLMAGYADQGASELLFHLFERMTQEGIEPSGVTFLSILKVCSHVGLVDDAQRYFQAMTKEYGTILTVEHYTCMVDLYGRAGQLEAAVAMVEKMPFQPDVVVWSSVLGACQNWKNIEFGRHAFENVMILDRKVHVAYVLMANIYADAHPMS